MPTAKTRLKRACKIKSCRWYHMASGDIIVDLLCTTGQITEGETALKLSADPAENIHPYRSVHYNDRMVIADIRLSVL